MEVSLVRNGPDPDLREGSLTPPDGILSGMTDHLEGPEYKLTLPVNKKLVKGQQQSCLHSERGD